MYIPKYFEVTDTNEVITFIKAHAFGQLISSFDERPVATHMPFLVSADRSCLRGHMARMNPQWQDLDGQTVLVTFQGPHDYISPSWYSSPNVPTWNYQAAHVYGTCRTLHRDTELALIVEDLTRHHEARFERPWEPDYRGAELRGIVGVEIAIGELQCSYKLNQNRCRRDQDQVARQLEELGSVELARAMRQHRH